ncbi:ArsC family reductase [uncultured Sphaerotilus sp.]|uniref:ArsC family reductase n=1 Tax=uncultured Sphaerotilus sp. TaxID=474984 RepID=UPI0030CA15C1
MSHPVALTLYGIPNCDTVKKARAWLVERGVAVTFHDFKKQGVPATALDAWIAQVGWETLLNRSGTTWRKLDDATRAAVTDAASARALMLAQASVIKRPVVQWPDGRHTVGFSPERFDALGQLLG